MDHQFDQSCCRAHVKVRCTRLGIQTGGDPAGLGREGGLPGDDRWTKEVMSWRTTAGRKKGRPEKRWIDNINNFISKATGTTVHGNDWMEWAQSQTSWSSWQEAFIHQQQLAHDVPAVGGP